ncbi:MAG: BCCT family transporter [Myxococcota bacterium]
MAHHKPKLAVSPPVFFISGGLLLLFMGFGVLDSATAMDVFSRLQEGASTRFGWFYVLSVAFFIVFILWLLFSRYARIRLGDDDDRPEFSTLTWFAMLFSAGMGIGLLFFGVAEPVMHYANPPGMEGRTAEAAQQAVPLTFFHWGVHAWAIYVVMGLAIAYFSFRKKLPLAIRSTFHPILGERVHGWPGHAIDILAVLGTLFGLATSLGLGAMQVNAGMHYLFDVAVSPNIQLLIIASITAAATISLVTGVDKGIRRLSELNMILAAMLMVFVFVVGPTQFLLDNFADNLGFYLRDFVVNTFHVRALGDHDWSKTWTLFYWGWWIAWAPFVGMFVARISRGRTIREFILGVILAPTVVTFVWFTVLGDTALWLEMFGGGGIADAVETEVSTAIFVVLERLPIAAVTSMLAAMVVAVFFVTSSDSASFVVDMLTSGGHPDPPTWQRVFWAVTEGAVAATLLYVGGREALDALQAAVISIGLPFCALLVIMCFSLLRALRRDPGAMPIPLRPTSHTAPPEPKDPPERRAAGE